ncbi:MAG: hypothetical protein CLLPBCKN_007732 [Chroococcidiopsis cubana SAG 39.79]|nr:hypothetical protein [Chroococcidiopsis cubana SAG 39.79]
MLGDPIYWVEGLRRNWQHNYIIRYSTNSCHSAIAWKSIPLTVRGVPVANRLAIADKVRSVTSESLAKHSKNAAKQSLWSGF